MVLYLISRPVKSNSYITDIHFYSPYSAALWIIILVHSNSVLNTGCVVHNRRIAISPAEERAVYFPPPGKWWNVRNLCQVHGGRHGEGYSWYPGRYSRRRIFQYNEDYFRFKFFFLARFQKVKRHINMETNRSCQLTVSLCLLVNL